MEAEGRGVPFTGTLPTLSDGGRAAISLGKFGQVLTSDLLPRYAESVARGLAFSAGTAATGVAPGTAIGTTSPFTLANPSGSGKNLIVTRARWAYISGTLGAGAVFFVANVVPSAAAVTGTACAVTKSLLSTATAGNVGLAFTTATLPAAPTILRPWFSMAPLLATSVVQPYVVREDLDGEFVIAPGCSLSFEATATAGTSPLGVYGVSWVEVAV